VYLSQMDAFWAKAGAATAARPATKVEGRMVIGVEVCGRRKNERAWDEREERNQGGLSRAYVVLHSMRSLWSFQIGRFPLVGGNKTHQRQWRMNKEQE